MTASNVLAALLVAVLAVAVVVGMSPLLFIPLFLIAGLVMLVPLWAALLRRTTFRRDAGAPSTSGASYDPVRRP
jgi:predicted membrane metal-binding protein